MEGNEDEPDGKGQRVRGESERERERRSGSGSVVEGEFTSEAERGGERETKRRAQLGEQNKERCSMGV